MPLNEVIYATRLFSHMHFVTLPIIIFYSLLYTSGTSIFYSLGDMPLLPSQKFRAEEARPGDNTNMMRFNSLDSFTDTVCTQHSHPTENGTFLPSSLSEPLPHTLFPSFFRLWQPACPDRNGSNSLKQLNYDLPINICKLISINPALTQADP